MTNEVTPVFEISISPIGAPIKVMAVEVLNNFIASGTKQRSYKCDSVGKFFRWPDAAQTSQARSANQAIDNGLGVIVLMMSSGDRGTILLFGNIDQILNSQISRSCLD